MSSEHAPAFAPPAALPRARAPARHAHAPRTPLPARRVVHLAVSTQRHADPSRRSKHDPAFRKLQRRHRQGPAAFRQARDADGGEAKSSGGGGGGAGAKQGGSRVVVVPRVRRPRFRAHGTPLSELSVGAELSGVAQNTLPHGVYVDVGAVVDGLVHVRDMAIDFVHEPDDLVRSGDRVTVWVKYVDAVANVLGLSMLRPARGGFADRTPLQDVQTGARLLGAVHRVTNFGAYVDIGATRPGFVHVTALWGRHPRDTLDALRLGSELWVHVAHVDVLSSHVVLKARSATGDRLDEYCEVDDGVGVNSRGWLLDDGPSEPAEAAAPAPSTKAATLRPGEELRDDDDDDAEEKDEGEEEGAEAALATGIEAEEAEEEDDDDDEFAFANDMETVQTGGTAPADGGAEAGSAGDEFAFAQESKLMQGGSAQLGQLAGLIDSETELVGFEEGDDLLGYLREKQARRKEAELGAYEDEDEDEEVEEDDEADDEDEDEDEEFDSVDAVEDADIDVRGRNLQSLLHSDVDF